MSRRMLAVFCLNHRQRSGGNPADGHAIPGSGLLLTTWQTPTLGFRKQKRQLRTGSTGGCLRSIAQRTRSGACSYWISDGSLAPVQATVFSTTSIMTTRIFALRCALTTHPPDCRCQTVVHAERPAAQPEQMRSTDHRNDTPTMNCDINRVIRHCC